MSTLSTSRTISPPRSAVHVLSLRLIGLVGATLLCWLVTTVAQLQKYLSMPKAALAAVAGCIGITVVLFALARSSRDLPRWSIPACWLLLALSFAAIYPRSQRHLPGKGSDREDALRVELVAIAHGQYPYDVRTFLGHPPTPLPGAMLLAAPFFLVGRVALQNLAWAAIFLLVLSRFFARRATSVAFVLIFLVTALENLNDFDVGGDYVTNILYIAVALYLVDRAVGPAVPAWQTVLALALFGIALSSRIIYIVSIPPLFALLRQRTGTRRAGVLIGMALGVTLLVTIPVFAPHPVSRLLLQLQQNGDKLKYLPRVLRSGALPIAALAVSASSLFLTMSLTRVYLMTGLATLAMLGPAMLGVVLSQGGIARPLTTDLEYLAVPSLFIGLWLFARIEQASLPSPAVPQANLQLH